VRGNSRLVHRGIRRGFSRGPHGTKAFIYGPFFKGLAEPLCAPARPECETMDTPIALSIKDFCRNYGVGRSLAYQLIGSGTLEAKKLGAKTLIDSASAERWYRSLPEFSPARRITKMRKTRAAAQ